MNQDRNNDMEVMNDFGMDPEPTVPKVPETVAPSAPTPLTQPVNINVASAPAPTAVPLEPYLTEEPKLDEVVKEVPPLEPQPAPMNPVPLQPEVMESPVAINPVLPNGEQVKVEPAVVTEAPKTTTKKGSKAGLVLVIILLMIIAGVVIFLPQITDLIEDLGF